ncbi:hypothetical protein I4F81_011027 [Pyropia yezoensis]|uniref:Uncharacterized protein n=1 Tax=Pyropia yezoensis TaxID=2788 RepID=A0ACC3CFK1_PYRYE|nr:hypothetical protein I4F81_011027 [Neopyropia yezoensis]
MARLLQVRGALRCLVVELGSAAPDALLPLDSENFWSELAAAETIIRPIAKASFVFERDDATMADAIGIYGCLFHHLAKSERANAIVQQTFDFLTGNIENLSCAPPLTGDQSSRAAGWTWLKFWEFLSMGGKCPELAKFALLLLSCKPQTASVERLFKEYVAQRTKARNRMGLATINKVTAAKSACDHTRHRSGSSKSRNRVLAASERARLPAEPTAALLPAAPDVGADEVAPTDGGSSSAAILQGWTGGLEGLNDADEATSQEPRGEVPPFMAFDFSVLAVPERACPSVATDVAMNPQEIMWRLRSFRAAKVPLRHLVGRRTGEQFAVDMRALVSDD